jgi:hypothetical protein
MKLHKESVSPDLLTILEKLISSDVFRDFILVGGTALSLQRGHRRSIDIDLFTALPYGEMPIAEIRRFVESEFDVHKGSETLDCDAIGYHLFVGAGNNPPVKLDLFYTEPFIFPARVVDGIRMADQREIAAMKMLAIGGPVRRQKDFWDIHEMLSDYSLADMIKWGLDRNPYSLTKNDIITGFEAIDSIEESPEGIDSLRRNDYWELKVLDLKDEIARFKAGR